jgi:hypothetical protein
VWKCKPPAFDFHAPISTRDSGNFIERVIPILTMFAKTWAIELKYRSGNRAVLFFYYIYLGEIQGFALSICQNPGQTGWRQAM